MRCSCDLPAGLASVHGGSKPSRRQSRSTRLDVLPTAPLQIRASLPELTAVARAARRLAPEERTPMRPPRIAGTPAPSVLWGRRQQPACWRRTQVLLRHPRGHAHTPSAQPASLSPANKRALRCWRALLQAPRASAPPSCRSFLWPTLRASPAPAGAHSRTVRFRCGGRGWPCCWGVLGCGWNAARCTANCQNRASSPRWWQ